MAKLGDTLAGMPKAAIRIDQVGLSPGEDDRSRSDGLSTGAAVTLTSLFPGTTNTFTFLWTPDEDNDAVTSLVNHGTYSTFTPTPGVTGTYRIKLEVKTGGIKAVVIRTFSIRTAVLGLRKPALGERADDSASLINRNKQSSETNEASPGRFEDGSYAGWYPAYLELVDAAETLAETVEEGLAEISPIPLFVYSPASSSESTFVYDTFLAMYTAVRAFIDEADGIAVARVLLGANVPLSSGAWNFDGFEFESDPNLNAILTFTGSATMTHPPLVMKNVCIDSQVNGVLCTLGAGLRSIHLFGNSYISSSSGSAGARVFSLTAGLLFMHCHDTVQLYTLSAGNFANVATGANLNIYLKDESSIVTFGGFSGIFFTGGSGGTVRVYMLGGWVSTVGASKTAGFINQDPLSTSNLPPVQIIDANQRIYQTTFTVSVGTPNNIPMFPTTGVRAKYTRLTAATPASITGIVAEGEAVLTEHFLPNVGSNAITWAHNSGSSSSGFRILCAHNTNMVQNPGSVVHLVYDHTTQAWRATLLGGGAFTGDSGSGGVMGQVPAPAAGDAAAHKFLKANGLWETLRNQPLAADHSTAWTIAKADWGKKHRSIAATNPNAVITIPTAVSMVGGAPDIGDTLVVKWVATAAGQPSFSPAGGVTLIDPTKNKMAAAGGTVVLHYIAVNTYEIDGSVTT